MDMNLKESIPEYALKPAVSASESGSAGDIKYKTDSLSADTFEIITEPPKMPIQGHQQEPERKQEQEQKPEWKQVREDLNAEYPSLGKAADSSTAAEKRTGENTEIAARDEKQTDAWVHNETVRDYKFAPPHREEKKRFSETEKQSVAASIPADASVMAADVSDPPKIEPVSDMSITETASFTEMISYPGNFIEIEEDILVPDTKPDLQKILFADGIPTFEVKDTYMAGGGRNIRITGNVDICIVYIPESDPASLIPVRSQISVRREIKVGAVNENRTSEFEITSAVEKMETAVINERKVRVKAVIRLDIEEYIPRDIVLFQGLDDSETEVLKTGIEVSDAAARRKDIAEIKEIVRLRDGMMPISSVLKADMHVTEVNRQITGNKLMINAALECGILYIPGGEAALPDTFRTKVEFTQFIKLRQGEVPESGSASLINTRYTVISNEVIPVTGDSGKTDSFEINAAIEISAQIYRTIEKEIVTDMYHKVRNITFENKISSFMCLKSIKTHDVTVRETIYLQTVSELEKLMYINACISDESLSRSEERLDFSCSLNVYGAVCARDSKQTDIRETTGREPGRGINSLSILPIENIYPVSASFDERRGEPDTMVIARACVKDMRCELINGRQIELSAIITVQTCEYSSRNYTMIENVCFIEYKDESNEKSGFTLYTASPGDTLWSVGARFKTDVGSIIDVDSKQYLKSDPKSKLPAGKKYLIAK